MKRTTNRTTEITIERQRSFSARRVIQRRFSFCPTCYRENEFVTPEAAATRASVTVRTIYGWIESGQVHWLETPQGHLFVCSQSLP